MPEETARDIAHIRDYVDTRFDCISRESGVAAAELARRLDALNHAHEKAVEVQHTYIPREVFDRFLDSYEQRHADVANGIQQLLLSQTTYLPLAAFNGFVDRQDRDREAARVLLDQRTAETRRVVLSTLVLAGVSLLGVMIMALITLLH